jgi:hypothetical protein
MVMITYHLRNILKTQKPEFLITPICCFFLSKYLNSISCPHPFKWPSVRFLISWIFAMFTSHYMDSRLWGINLQFFQIPVSIFWGLFRAQSSLLVCLSYFKETYFLLIGNNSYVNLNPFVGLNKVFSYFLFFGYF